MRHASVGAASGGNEWYNCNDSVISRVEEKNSRSDAAYILFYERTALVKDNEQTAALFEAEAGAVAADIIKSMSGTCSSSSAPASADEKGHTPPKEEASDAAIAALLASDEEQHFNPDCE